MINRLLKIAHMNMRSYLGEKSFGAYKQVCDVGRVTFLPVFSFSQCVDHATHLKFVCVEHTRH